MTEFEVWYSFNNSVDSVTLWADTPEEALELFQNRKWFRVKVFSIDCEGQEVWKGERWYD